MITRKKIDGDNSGTVIDQNWRHLEAPSMDAASYNSRGIDFRPADKMMTLKPMDAHSPNRATANSAHPGVTSQ